MNGYFFNKNGTFIAYCYPPEDSFLSCQIPKGSAKFVYTAFDKPEDGTRSLLTLKNDEQYIIKIDYKTKTIEVYTEKRKNKTEQEKKTEKIKENKGKILNKATISK